MCTTNKRRDQPISIGARVGEGGLCYLILAADQTLCDMTIGGRGICCALCALCYGECGWGISLMLNIVFAR